MTMQRSEWKMRVEADSPVAERLRQRIDDQLLTWADIWKGMKPIEITEDTQKDNMLILETRDSHEWRCRPSDRFSARGATGGAGFIDEQHPARVCYFRVVRERFMLLTILGR